LPASHCVADKINKTAREDHEKVKFMKIRNVGREDLIAQLFSSLNLEKQNSKNNSSTYHFTFNQRFALVFLVMKSFCTRSADKTHQKSPKRSKSSIHYDESIPRLKTPEQSAFHSKHEMKMRKVGFQIKLYD
jgi:hypothetical protein